MADQNISVMLQLMDNASPALTQFVNNVQKAAKNVNDSVKSMSLSFNSMRNALVAGFSIRGIYLLVEDVQQMQNKLLATTGSVDEFNLALKASRDISNETGMALTDVANLLSKVTSNGAKFGLTTDEMTTSTYAFANALKASGAGAAGASSAMYQFGQIMNKGKADGDELKTVMENLSGPVLSLLAKKLGTNVAGLLEWRSKGMLSAEMVSKAFVAASGEIEAMTNKMPTTVGQAMNRIKNSFVDMIINLEKTTGIFSGLADAMSMVARNMDTIVLGISILVGAWMGAKMVLWIPMVIEFAGALMTAAKAIRAVGIAAAIAEALATGGVSAIGAVAGAAAAATAATVAFNLMDDAAVGSSKGLKETASAAQAAQGDLATLTAEQIKAAEAAKKAEEERKKAAEESLRIAKQQAENRKKFLIDLQVETIQMGMSTEAKKRNEALTLSLTISNESLRSIWLKQANAIITAWAAQEKLNKAKEEAIRIADAIRDKANSTIDDLQKQADGYDSMSEKSKTYYNLYIGDLKDADDALKKQIITLSEEVAVRKQQAETLKLEYDTRLKLIGLADEANKTLADSKTYFDILKTSGEVAADAWKVGAEAISEYTSKITSIENEITLLNEEKSAGYVIDEAQLSLLNAQLDVLKQQLPAYQAKAQAIAGIATEQEKINEKTKMWKDLVTGPQKELDLIAVSMDELNSLFADGKISAEVFNAELIKLNERKFKALGGQLSEIDQALVAMAKSLENSMGTFFFDIMQGKMTNMADSFKKMIDKMVADYLASQLSSMLFGGYASDRVSKVGVSAAGGGGLIGSIFGSLFKAQGGPVTGNSPYIVGEVGPELFIPKSSGTIIPSDITSKISAMGGKSSTNNLTVNVTAMDSQSVLNAMDKIKRPLAEMMTGTNRTYNLGGR